MNCQRLSAITCLALLLIAPMQALAVCSPFIGLASINEVSEGGEYIEIKRLSSSLTWDNAEPWRIEWCRQTKSNDLTPICSSPQALPSPSVSDDPWLVFDVSGIAPSLDLQGMDLRLTDADGRTVDYVSFERFSAAEDADCPADSPELIFDTELTVERGNSGNFASRVPDGTGDWAVSPGASGGTGSEDSSNDGNDVPGPSITIDNVSVSAGEPAVFTVSLSEPAGRDFLIDFATFDITAVDGENYSGDSGAVAIDQGTSTVTISVETFATGQTGDLQFYVLLGNARDGSGDRYGTFSSQVGVATVTPRETRVAQFDVQVPATASVCVPALISIRALDESGNVIPDYDGLVQLSTSSGSGNWTAVDQGDIPEGALSPSPDEDNDGLVQYLFAPSDGGTVSLSLANRTADVLRVVVEGTESGTRTESGSVQFNENALVIESVDSNGLDIIAERHHQFVVRAIGRNTATGEECTQLTEYDGPIGIKAWLSRTSDDAGGSAPRAISGSDELILPDSLPPDDNLDLAFSEGSAPLTLQTDDVGQYRLLFREDSSGIVVKPDGTSLPVVGASALWTVRPERFDVVVTGNPGASDASGRVFRRAGEVFEASVTAVGAAGGELLSYGAEGTPQGASIQSELLFPVAGEEGVLSGSTEFPGADFTAGRSSADDLSWNEVGIIRLIASNSSYLGVTPEITGQTGPVGRFVPDRFELSVDQGELASFCSSPGPFIYAGQPIGWELAPEVTITAYGPDSYVTRNYTEGSFRKLAATDISRTAPVADSQATVQSGAPYPISTDSEPGTLSVMGPGVMAFRYSTSDALTYTKTVDSLVGPFTPAPVFAINSVIDADGVAATAVPLEFIPDAPPAVRYGRLSMENVYGPENIAALEMPFRVEYWDGARFALNTDDSCTAWNTADISNTANHHTLVADSGTVSGGTAGPLVLQPNGTQGTDTLVWVVEDWLREDDDGDGTLDNPVGLATFGVFRGHDRVIYWQEP